MELRAIDYAAADAEQAFVASLRETGFGVLRNHPIEQALVDRIYEQWLAFFASDAKYDYPYNKGSQDGYFPPDVSEVAKGHQVKDIKEYFQYYSWGQCPPALREDLARYYAEVGSLAIELLSWIERQSPPEVLARYSQPLSEMVAGSDLSMLRILHYPAFTGAEEAGAIRAAAHEDINLITLLPAASAPRLQVLASDGEWLDVPSDFGNLVINVGDMLQEASAGWFPSTTHRVINPELKEHNEARMSLPLFLHPRGDVVLSERYTAASYLRERLEELGVV